jgi:thiamine pyrophosphate-dependent acetolactate synthase large subunit-like protein
METPKAPGTIREFWASDAIAALLRALEIPFVALNPGASLRGLHDSLVNYLGNERPQALLCLHEESAVAVAHGYARASGRMMAAALHADAGLMHASMAIYNAWCDRVPVLILGAGAEQAALVRGCTKWDDQPASVPAACEALLRAAQLAGAAPRAPVYVHLAPALQEAKLAALPPLPEVNRYRSPEPAVAPAAQIKAAAELLSRARNPVILAGRAGRGGMAWKARVALAEKLRAKVVTSLRSAAAFPTDHPLHVPAQELRSADVVLALDWVDTGGTLKKVLGEASIRPKVILVSADAHLQRGSSMDYQGLPPADVYLMCEPDAILTELLEAVDPRSGPSLAPQPTEELPKVSDALNLRALAMAFNEATAGRNVCLARVPGGWEPGYRHWRHPLDYLGGDGGAGVGAGPGLTVGAALALRGTGRLVAGILGDGDFLMGATALWTATHYRLPCLIVVANERSFNGNWTGQRITDPAVDLAMLAAAQGAVGIGPVTELGELLPALIEGVKKVAGGAVCVVDVRVTA